MDRRSGWRSLILVVLLLAGCGSFTHPTRLLYQEGPISTTPDWDGTALGGFLARGQFNGEWDEKGGLLWVSILSGAVTAKRGSLDLSHPRDTTWTYFRSPCGDTSCADSSAVFLYDTTWINCLPTVLDSIIGASSGGPAHAHARFVVPATNGLPEILSCYFSRYPGTLPLAIESAPDMEGKGAGPSYLLIPAGPTPSGYIRLSAWGVLGYSP